MRRTHSKAEIALSHIDLAAEARAAGESSEIGAKLLLSEAARRGHRGTRLHEGCGGRKAGGHSIGYSELDESIELHGDLQEIV